MGVRKHLKATLGLLAFGGVAFAGAAHAANGKGEIYVKQHAKTSATVEAPDSYNQVSTVTVNGTTEGRAVQINTDNKAPNKAYIAQGESNAQVDKATIKLAQIGKGNQVGDDKDNPLVMKATGHNATLTIVQAKEENNNSNASNDAVTGNKVVSDDLASTKLTIEATKGNNTVTIKQKSDGNKVYVGQVKGGSVDLTITQKGTSNEDNGGIIRFTKLTANNAIDLNLTQNGDKNKMLFGSYDGQDDASLSQEVSVNSISGGIDQEGNDNLVQMFKVDASSADVTLKNYDGSADLSQDGSDVIKLNNVKVEGATADFYVTQGSGTNTIVMGDINSSGEAEKLVKFGESVTFKANQSDYADIKILNSTFTDNANFDIQQSGGSSTDHNQVAIENTTVRGTTDVTIVQNENGNNRVFVGTDVQSFEVDGNVTAKITQSGKDNLFQIVSGTVGSDLTVKGYSDDTLTMDGDDNAVVFANLSSGSDTTVAMDISGDDNQFLADVNAGTTNSIKMNISGNSNTFYGASADSNDNVTQNAGSNLIMHAGGKNDFDVQITGDSNQIGLEQVASADNTFHAVINGSNNHIGVYQHNANGSNYVDINIASSGNTISIYQDVANTSGDATVLVYQN